MLNTLLFFNGSGGVHPTKHVINIIVVKQNGPRFESQSQLLQPRLNHSPTLRLHTADLGEMTVGNQ